MAAIVTSPAAAAPAAAAPVTLADFRNAGTLPARDPNAARGTYSGDYFGEASAGFIRLALAAYGVNVKLAPDAAALAYEVARAFADANKIWVERRKATKL